MRRILDVCLLWIAVVMSTCGTQGVFLAASANTAVTVVPHSEVHCVSAAPEKSEPWETRGSSLSVIFAKIEQAAVAIAVDDAEDDRHAAFRVAAGSPFPSPAILRLADDLSHVRLLI